MRRTALGYVAGDAALVKAFLLCGLSWVRDVARRRCRQRG
jgi:hypothetical protein